MLKIQEKTKQVKDLIIASVAVLGVAVVGIVGVGVVIAKKVTAASIGAGQVAPGNQGISSQNMLKKQSKIKNQIESFESTHQIIEREFNTIDLELAEWLLIKWFDFIDIKQEKFDKAKLH